MTLGDMRVGFTINITQSDDIRQKKKFKLCSKAPFLSHHDFG